ncbi:hypothetical protein N9V43_00530 [Flavobacteriales bacterium]|jgi:hypothetical protein|nr:hypothetical protein [Flavobacteriales bacterium]
MYIGLLHLHSNLPYILLVLILAVLVKSLLGWVQSSPFDKLSNKLVLFSMITIHLQWTIGAILYFVSPNVKSLGEAMGDSLSRLYALEHPLMMTVALVLLTIARSKSKKSEDSSNHRRTFILFAIATLCMVWSLPPSWL